jgi:hypothetical protein
VKSFFVSLFIISLVLLSGCESLSGVAVDVAKEAVLGDDSDKGGISLDTQIGDKKSEVAAVSTKRGAGDIVAKDKAHVTVTNTTQESRAKIETNNGTIKVEQTPPWLILVAILGWLLPTPQSMIAWLCRKYQEYRLNKSLKDFPTQDKLENQEETDENGQPVHTDNS